jgi:hypothetical protein
MSNDPVTLGELQRTLEKMEAQITQRFDQFDRRLDAHNATYLRSDVYVAAHQALADKVGVVDGRVDGIQEGLTWVRRAFFGALIAVGVGVLVPLVTIAAAVRGG